MVLLTWLQVHKIAKLERIKASSELVFDIHTKAQSLYFIKANIFLYSLKDDNFYKSGNSRAISEFDRVLSEISKELNKVEYDLEDKLKTKVTSTQKQLLVANELFQKLINGHRELGHEEYGLVGSWRKDIHLVEESLKNNPILYPIILNMRRYEKDLLLRFDDRFLVKFNTLYEKAKSYNQINSQKNILKNLIIII